MSFVFVTNTDARRHRVDVAQGSFMIDVLEEACKKFKLSSDRYQLKHNNKQINLTDQFRIVGLSQGAKLDLVVKPKSPSAVTVALRLPESETRLGIPNNRVSDKVRSDTTLWKLLRHFEETGVGKQRGLNITARGIPSTSNGAQSGSGQLFWEEPVLKVAGRELRSLVDLQKTLSQAGIDQGSQLIMVEFRRTETTLQDAMRNVDQFFSEPDVSKEAPVAPTAPTTSQSTEPQSLSGQPAPELEPLPAASTQLPPESTSTIETNPTAQDTPAAITPGPEATEPPTHNPDAMAIDTPFPPTLQPLEILSPATTTTLAATLAAEPDYVYEPNIALMQAHQEHIKAGTHNQRLKSDRELAAAAHADAARLAAIKQVEIRVRFPDGHAAKWQFGADATGATVYAAVRGVLARPDMAFKLTLPGGGGDIVDEGGEKHGLIRGYRLKGGVAVSLTILDGDAKNIRNQVFLKDAVLSKAQEIVVPQPVQVAEEVGDASRPVRPEQTEGESGAKKSRTPKWLKGLPGMKK